MRFTDLVFEEWDNFDTVRIGENDIEVKKYLPIAEKIQLISKVIGNSFTEEGYNPIFAEIATSMEILLAYTNIEFSEKELEDISAVYDILEKNSIFDIVFSVIPEYNLLLSWIEECITITKDNRNSAAGVIGRILELMNTASEDSAELNNIIENLKDPEKLSTLKDVLEKLG